MNVSHVASTSFGKDNNAWPEKKHPYYSENMPDDALVCWCNDGSGQPYPYTAGQLRREKMAAIKESMKNSSRKNPIKDGELIKKINAHNADNKGITKLDMEHATQRAEQEETFKKEIEALRKEKEGKIEEIKSKIIPYESLIEELDDCEKQYNEKMYELLKNQSERRALLESIQEAERRKYAKCQDTGNTGKWSNWGDNYAYYTGK